MPLMFVSCSTLLCNDFVDRKAQIGQKATTKLLQGAEKTASEAVSPKTYKKHGTYQDAVKDFFSVDPRSVSKFGSSVVSDGFLI